MEMVEEHRRETTHPHPVSQCPATPRLLDEVHAMMLAWEQGSYRYLHHDTTTSTLIIIIMQ